MDVWAQTLSPPARMAAEIRMDKDFCPLFSLISLMIFVTFKSMALFESPQHSYWIVIPFMFFKVQLFLDWKRFINWNTG